MGGDPSRPNRTTARPSARHSTVAERLAWPCVHTDLDVDPDSTVCLAGFCIRCGMHFHEPRGFPRVRANRNDKLRAALVERDGPWCVYCDRLFTRDLPATVDHVIPRAAGGTNDIGNLALACEPCNNWKADQVGVPRGAYVERFGAGSNGPGLAVAV